MDKPSNITQELSYLKSTISYYFALFIGSFWWALSLITCTARSILGRCPNKEKECGEIKEEDETRVSSTRKIEKPTKNLLETEKVGEEMGNEVVVPKMYDEFVESSNAANTANTANTGTQSQTVIPSHQYDNHPPNQSENHSYRRRSSSVSSQDSFDRRRNSTTSISSASSASTTPPHNYSKKHHRLSLSTLKEKLASKVHKPNSFVGRDDDDELDDISHHDNDDNETDHSITTGHESLKRIKEKLAQHRKRRWSGASEMGESAMKHVRDYKSTVLEERMGATVPPEWWKKMKGSIVEAGKVLEEKTKNRRWSA